MSHSFYKKIVMFGRVTCDVHSLDSFLGNEVMLLNFWNSALLVCME